MRASNTNLLDYTSYKLCCLEIVRYIRLEGQRLNPMTHREDQAIGEEVSSKLPKFRGQQLLKAAT